MKTVQRPFSQSLIRSALLTALGVAATTPLGAAIINPGFETGTTGWAESGGAGNFVSTASLTGLYGAVAPSSGNAFGLITNDGVASDLIAQTFAVPSGTSYLSFNYRFLTDSLNDPAFNDAARAVLTPLTGSPVTLFSVSRDDLQAGGAGPLLAGVQYFDFQTIAQDGWRTYVADLSAYAGQNVTLSFSIDSGGDPDNLLQSSLAIDGIGISAVPEPGSAALLAGIPAGLLLRRRRKRVD